MENREFRLGNFVFDRRGRIIKIDFFEHLENELSCKFGQKKENDIPLVEFTDKANPICVNDEWLIKLGFIKYDQMGENSFWNYSLPNQRCWNIAIFGNDIYVSFGSLNWDNCPIIKHVHQLQNLYFALTGQELELK